MGRLRQLSFCNIVTMTSRGLTSLLLGLLGVTTGSNRRPIGRIALTLSLVLSSVSCERERIIAIGCSTPPRDRVLVEISRQNGRTLGVGDLAPDVFELGALLKVTPTVSTDSPAVLRKLYVLQGADLTRARDGPIEVSTLITTPSIRVDADVERDAAFERANLVKWVKDRTKIQLNNTVTRTLDDLETLANKDSRAVELIRSDNTVSDFLVVSSVVYGTSLGMSFDLGTETPIAINAFRMGRMNVHIGFECHRLARLQRLSGEDEGTLVPLLVQYSAIRYDHHTGRLTASARLDNVESYLHSQSH